MRHCRTRNTTGGSHSASPACTVRTVRECCVFVCTVRRRPQVRTYCAALPPDGPCPTLPRPWRLCLIDWLLRVACLPPGLASTDLIGLRPYPTWCTYHVHGGSGRLLCAARLHTPRPFLGCLVLLAGWTRGMQCSPTSQPD
eukprot:353604-Chlamydomonas_euryale.AAC.2